MHINTYLAVFWMTECVKQKVKEMTSGVTHYSLCYKRITVSPSPPPPFSSILN